MKFKLLTLSMLLIASTASANPYQDFMENGEGAYGINFQMNGESQAMRQSLEAQDRQLMGGISAAAALASVPEKEGRYFGAGVGKYRQAESIALVGGMTTEAKSFKAGLAYDDSHHVTAMAGMSFSF